MISPDQVQHFWRHGYVGGVDVLTPAVCARIWRHVDRSERLEGSDTWADPDHPVARLLRGLARDPKLLSVMRAVLGPDLMIRNAEIFTKEPGSDKHIAWHVDTHVRWPESRGLVNLWLALTPSTVETGCLRVLPDLHTGDPAHVSRDREDLTFPDPVAAAMDTTTAVDLELQPGQASLHHFRTPHTSGWSRSGQRRIGFVVRFLGAGVTPEAAECGQATLVSGTALPGFGLRPDFDLGWTTNRR